MRYQSYCLHTHFFQVMCSTLIKSQINYKSEYYDEKQLQFMRSKIFKLLIENSRMKETCRAILRDVFRIGGLNKIRLQTALRPCVTRSPLYNSLSSLALLPGQHKHSNNLKIEFGRWGASPSNLLKDLSEAGKESLSVSACKIKLE